MILPYGTKHRAVHFIGRRSISSSGSLQGRPTSPLQALVISPEDVEHPSDFSFFLGVKRDCSESSSCERGGLCHFCGQAAVVTIVGEASKRLLGKLDCIARKPARISLEVAPHVGALAQVECDGLSVLGK